MNCPEMDFSVSGPGFSTRSRDYRGGLNSAQLACIYMAFWETKNTAVALFIPHTLACRYRDNIFLFGRKSLLLQRLPELQHPLALIYCMPVQFEQIGSCIYVLEVSLCLHP